MPLYEYRCDACGHKFEQIQLFSDPILTVCEECGGALKKLISSPAFQLKGSGWYASDYPKAAAAGAPGSGASGGEQGGSGEKAGSDKSDGGAGSETKSADSRSETSSDKPADRSSDKSGDKSSDKPGSKSSEKAGDKTAPAPAKPVQGS